MDPGSQPPPQETCAAQQSQRHSDVTPDVASGADSEATQSVSVATQSASQETISAGAEEEEEEEIEAAVEAGPEPSPPLSTGGAPISSNLAGQKPATKVASETEDHPVTWSWAYKWVDVERPFGLASLKLRKWVREVREGRGTVRRRGMRTVETGKDGTPIIVGGFMEYHCPFPGCRKVFTSSGSLRKHMHIHGEKHFVCDHPGCGKRFIDKSKLKRHLLTHASDRKPRGQKEVSAQEKAKT